MSKAVHFQGMSSISFLDSGGRTLSSTSSLYGDFEEDRHDMGLICWRDLVATYKKDQLPEEEVKNDPLFLFFKDRSWVQLQLGCVGGDSRLSVEEEEEIDVMGTGRVPMELSVRFIWSRFGFWELLLTASVEMRGSFFFFHILGEVQLTRW